MSARYASCMSVILLSVMLPHAAWGDKSGVATLAPNSFLNLDTGVISAATGDIVWSGGH
jgi:hypothetical protein